jgi:hypothetical protein
VDAGSLDGLSTPIGATVPAQPLCSATGNGVVLGAGRRAPAIRRASALQGSDLCVLVLHVSSESFDRDDGRDRVGGRCRGRTVYPTGLVSLPPTPPLHDDHLMLRRFPG